MATRIKRTFAIYRQEGKEGVIVNKDPGEEASQTWIKGAPLTEDSSSKELKIWAGTTNADKIVGIAAKDATGTTGADVPYIEATDYNLFAATLVDATSDHVLAAGDINTAYSLIADGDNWYVDKNDTTTKKVIVIAPIDDIGDTNARVVVRFATDFQQKVGAA